VAVCAQGDEVFFGIVSELAPCADVMDLEVGKISAVLAAPPIPFEHLTPQFQIRRRTELQSRSSGTEPSHDAVRTCSSKSNFWSCGRNLMSRSSERSSAWGFPFSSRLRKKSDLCDRMKERCV
jgi:hypothetical protein